jgi:hypothetical protein
MLSFQMSFDIQDCILQTTCKRKHLILDKDYNCYIFPRLLVIAEVTIIISGLIFFYY